MARRHDALADLIRSAAADGFLGADPATVAWLTGHVGAAMTVPASFALGPFVLAGNDGALTLIAADDVELAPDVEERVELVRLPTPEPGELDRLADARAALTPLVAGMKLAVEASSVPIGLLADATEWVDAGAAVLRARAVKDPDEIQLLRSAIELCDVAQRALREALRAGESELALHAAVQRAIDRRAGAPTPIVEDLVVGERTAQIGGQPGLLQIADGELVLYDVQPRYEGVWGDCCATVALGEPSAWARKAQGRTLDALEAAIEAIGPGVHAGALDTIVRERLPDLPHHVGHGIGWSSHELPRIVPGSATPLEPGMVIAIEPGLYGEHEGVRVERVMRVTDDGCEILSAHDLTL